MKILAAGRVFLYGGLAAIVLLGARETSGGNRRVLSVSSAQQLEEAVARANRSGGEVTILLAPGIYPLDHTLDIEARDITLAGAPDQSAHTIIQGDAMSPTARIGDLVRVAASNFQLRDLTLRRSRLHLIQIAGEDRAEAPVIRDCILQDANEQLLKVSFDARHPEAHSDRGTVDHCVFEYTAGIGPQYYIGGIDAHGARDWRVSNNVFRDIASPSRDVAEFAIHFWEGSADDVVQGNTIIDCDRGIGFGLDGRPNQGGLIANNRIFHSDNRAPFADVGIALVDSPDTRVQTNVIYFENSYPNAIEYRFPATRGIQIVGNVANRRIAARDGASGTVSGNVTDATAAWFIHAAVGDLRLSRFGSEQLGQK
jgi:hypothetical protein